MNSRRLFIKKSFFTLSSLPLSPLLFTSASSPPHRIKKGNMIYRRLGRTGFYVSEISLGSSPLPDWGIALTPTWEEMLNVKLAALLAK